MVFLIINSTLELNKNMFRLEDICLLVNKLYPQEFTNYEKLILTMELRHY